MSRTLAQHLHAGHPVDSHPGPDGAWTHTRYPTGPPDTLVQLAIDNLYCGGLDDQARAVRDLLERFTELLATLGDAVEVGEAYAGILDRLLEHGARHGAKGSPS